MKLGLTIFFALSVIVQSFSSLSNFSVSDFIGVKSIVACKDCKRK